MRRCKWRSWSARGRTADALTSSVFVGGADYDRVVERVAGVDRSRGCQQPVDAPVARHRHDEPGGQDVLAVSQHDLVGEVEHAVTVPTLLLVGEKELKIMRESVRDLLAAMSAARGYVVTGAIH